MQCREFRELLDAYLDNELSPAEREALLAHAREKLAHKGADLIVANDVSRPESTFGADTNRVALVSADGVEQLETMPLADVANAILDAVLRMVTR